MKIAVLILALMLTSSTAFAQDTPVITTETAPEKSKLALGIDVVYPYLWRGLRLNGNKVAFQPYASYAISNKLTAGVWGSTNLSDGERAYNEFDWYVSYQITPIIKVMLSDYYYNATKKNNEVYEGLRNSYWKYDGHSPHVMDLSLFLNFSEKGVPLDFQVNTYILGNDSKHDANGDRKRAFSTYSEIGYTLSIKNIGIDLRPFVGAAVINEGGSYGVDESGNAGFAFTNVGVNAAKSIQFSEKFSLPVFIRYTYNENGNLNDKGDGITHHFISGGMTFTIK